MGKITVIKHFALHKLIYALSSLQYPPKEIIKEIKKKKIVCFHLGRKNRKDKKGNINSGLRKWRFKNDRFRNVHYVAENKLVETNFGI